MREILFRGQTRRHGEKVKLDGDKVPSHWIYGGIFQGTGDYSVIYDINGKYAVYSDTVGQYTGLKDKYGERIFEGDIVRIQSENYEVKYLLGQFFVGINMPIAYKRFECEVIGNIHDNPELLKEGAHE